MAVAQKKQLLLVDGAITQVLSVEVTKEVDTLEFFDKIQIPKNTVMTPVLPHNTRMYRSNAAGEEYVFEEPPGIWMVSHVSADNAVFQIAVPWTVFTVGVSRSGVIGQPYLHFSRNRVTDPTATSLASSFLPNQHSSGVCCGGDEFTRIMSSRDSVFARLNKIVPFFKNSLFNEDLRPNYIPERILQITGNEPELADLDRNMFAIRLLNAGSRQHNMELLCRWHLWTMIASRRYADNAAALRAICELIPDRGGVTLNDCSRIRQ
jgi:hypothetical protein